METIKTTIKRKRYCRRCKKTYLSVDNSSCPFCEKRKEEKKLAKEKKKEEQEDVG